MSAEKTRDTLQQYMEALVARGDYGRFFDDDIEFAIVGSDQQARGAQAAEQAIRFMHETAFDAAPEISKLVVDDEGAAACSTTSRATRSRRCGSTCRWTSFSLRSAAQPNRKWPVPAAEGPRGRTKSTARRGHGHTCLQADDPRGQGG